MTMEDVNEYYYGTKCFRSELEISRRVAEKYVRSKSDLPIQEWIEHELRYNAMPDKGISTKTTTFNFSNEAGV